MSKQKQKRTESEPGSQRKLRKQLTVKDATDSGGESLRPEHWLSILLLLGLVGWSGYCMFLPFVMYLAGIGFTGAIVAMTVQFIRDRPRG